MSSSFSKIAELSLWASGSLLLLIAGSRIARYAAFQGGFAGPRPLTPVVHTQSQSSISAEARLAHLTIPRIGIDLQVLEGDDDATLSLGPAHLPESAPFGSLGNSIIAGHRDMAFRNLRFIRLGDEVRVTTRRTYVYAVDKLRIVPSDDLSVLRQAGEPALTIVTCYPFRYVGPAPERYIVRARLVPDVGQIGNPPPS